MIKCSVNSGVAWPHWHRLESGSHRHGHASQPQRTLRALATMSENTIASKKRSRGRASQGDTTRPIKLNSANEKAVTAALDAAIAQFDKLCYRRDNRAKCGKALISRLHGYVHDMEDPKQIAVARLGQIKRAKQKHGVSLIKKRKLARLEVEQLMEQQTPAFRAVGLFFGAMISLAAMQLVYKLVEKGHQKAPFCDWYERQRDRTNFDEFEMRGCTVDLLEDAARCAPSDTYATRSHWSSAYKVMQQSVNAFAQMMYDQCRVDIYAHYLKNTAGVRTLLGDDLENGGIIAFTRLFTVITNVVEQINSKAFGGSLDNHDVVGDLGSGYGLMLMLISVLYGAF